MTEIECAINNHTTVEGISPYADSLIEILKKAQQRIAELEKDATRLDWMQENFICADFRYGEPATEVIVIEIPRGARVCSDLRVDIDTAMQGA